MSDFSQIETDEHGTVRRLKVAKPFRWRGFYGVDEMKNLFVRRVTDIVP